MSEHNVPISDYNDEIELSLQDGIQVGGGGSSTVAWLPNVDASGDLSWTRSSTTTPPETVNIKGADGADGQDGAPGQDGADGVGVKSVDIDGNDHLIVTYDDDRTHDAGAIPGADTADYPAYAVTERDLVYAAIKGYISSLDNPIIIGFNTDQHIDSESSSSGTVAIRNEVTYGLKTLRDLTKMLPFNMVVLGGDTHGSGAGTIVSMQNSSLYINAQMVGTNAPLMAMVGNHEGGQDNQSITRSQVLQSHMTESMRDKTITLVDKISGYFDDPTCKVRFVFLDAFARTQVSYGSTEYNSVLNTMLSGIPEGYKAIIFSHHPLDENLPQVAERKGWNNPASCHATLQTYKDKIIACFCGHVHNNLNVDQDGITFVSTTCAGQYELNDGSTRTNGTAAATAYDVFVIDQTGKKIYAVRYGNGQDREISYEHETPVVPRGNILANITWEDGKRINSSGSLVDATGYSTTDIIDDINPGDILYFADGTLPMNTSSWTEYADDGTTVGSHAGISTSDYGASYENGKMYFEFLGSSDGKVIAIHWYGVNNAKNPNGTTYGTNRFVYGELELWNSGYIKSVKLAYDEEHFQTLKKIRFTFPTDKKSTLDIRVNEPIT